ncbi:MAG: MarR family transcriptional regulator [Lactobacillus sp.]|nr:MAG: MarR family transcriptional regulator [Lactobacillus sp.]
MANEQKNLNTLFELITILNQLIFEPKMIQKIKLSKNEILILGLIKEGSQPAMSELANRLGTSPAQITRSVTGLEKKSLVKRVINPTNRRIINVILTPAGNQLIGQHEQAVRTKLQKQLAAVSTADYNELDHALQQAVTILKRTTLGG